MYKQFLLAAIAIIVVVAAQQDEIVSSIAEYEASITAQPEFTSAINFLATGVDRDVLASITQDAAGLIPVTATPTWFTVFPTDVQDFLESAGSAERDISSSIASRYAATHVVPAGPNRNGGPSILNKPSIPILSMVAVMAIGCVFLML